MNPSIVALVHCETYADADVKRAVHQGIELVGGIEQFADKDETILLKPNLLSAKAPEKAVTTHPAIFKAVAELFMEAGANVIYGDSPGIGSPQSVAQKAGLAPVARQLQIPLADFKNGENVSFDAGRLVKQFVIANGVRKAQGLISLPKLKTHGLTRLTGAVKNQFGCIPGLLKAEYHLKFPTADLFSQMLVDLNLLLKPRLYIMDGILAMEGNGPGNGDPTFMSLLLFSTDPVALDAIVCRLFELSPDSLPTNQLGAESGLGNWQPSRVKLVGAPLEKFIKRHFNVNRAILSVKHQRYSRFLKNFLVAQPVIDADKCTRCGTCVKVCPVKPPAVQFEEDNQHMPPVYDYRRCIRCYCCQELCPENAIQLQYHWLVRWWRGR